MNFLVCMKAVPSTTEVRMDPTTNTIVRDGRLSVVNPFDASALEEAVRLKESIGGDVRVVSMGIPDTVRLLRDCLSRGANSGLLLSDRAFAGADTLATSYALSCAVHQLAERDGWHADLILCGKMAVDGDTAQIGPELASALDIPCVTGVCEILDVVPARGTGPTKSGRVRVRRVAQGGHEIVECPLPAVLTVEKDICNPRMPSIAGVRFGQTGPVEVETAAQVGADTTRTGLTGSPTQVVRSFTPERSHEAQPIVGTPQEQAEALTELIEGMGL